MDVFFNEWDRLERSYPWGVQYLSPFFSGYGIPMHMCEEVDNRLYIDLMLTRIQDSRRIKVEGRHSDCMFWVHIVLYQSIATIGFQRNPSTPYLRIVTLVATPTSIVASILAFHRWDTQMVDEGRVCRNWKWKSSWSVKRVKWVYFRSSNSSVWSIKKYDTSDFVMIVRQTTVHSSRSIISA